MKKFSKLLAIALAFVLAVGTIPAAAASSDQVVLKKTKKTIFVDGCTGSTSAGKAAKFYKTSTVSKLLKNFDSKTMDIKLSSSDTSIATTNNKKDRIYAKAPGKAAVTVTVYEGKELIYTGSIVVTVKKNATENTLLVEGIKDGDTVKVGDKVKVSLTRKSGSDTDLRRLSCSDSSVKVEEAGTRKYNVTFEKAGTYTLLAESYMSSKYAGATASKKISVTVSGDAKEEEKKEEEKKEEEKKKTTELTAVQTATNIIKVTGSVITDAFDSDDFKLEYQVGNVQIGYSGYIENVKATNGEAEIIFYSELPMDTAFTIKIGEETATFKTITFDYENVLSNIKTMRFKTNQLEAGVDTKVEYVYLDKNGIDITELVSGTADVQVTLEIVSGGEYGSVYGQNAIIYEKGRQMVVKAELITGYDLKDYKSIVVNTTGAFVGYEKPLPTVTNTLFTITDSTDAKYLKKSDSRIQYACLNESNIALEVLLAYSDGVYKTPAEAGVTEIKSSNPTVLMIGGTTVSGGVEVYTNTVGTSYVGLYVGEKLLTGFNVEVKKERVASRLIVNPDKTLLNVNPTAGDSIVLSAVVYDQYNEIMKNPPLTVEQLPATLNNAVVSFGSFVNGKLTVLGTSVSIVGTQRSVVATVKCGNLSSNFSFSVKDSPFDMAKLNTYRIAVNVDGMKTVDTALANGKQNVEETGVSVIISDNDGYYLYEAAYLGIGAVLTDAPKASMKASDLGKVAGTTILASTIQFKAENSSNTVFINSGENIDILESGIFFTPVTAGKKLAKGTYTIRFYVITLNENNSTIKPLTPVTVNVIESTGRGKSERKEESAKASGTIAQMIPVFFDFYYDDEKLDPSLIKSVDSISSTNDTIYVKSVTFGLTNDVYGAFDAVIPVNGVIKVKS